MAKTLELQQGKVLWAASPRSDFPNLDPVSAYVMTPGLCLAFRGTSGDTLQRFCSGAPVPANPPPQAFTAFYRGLFDLYKATPESIRAQRDAAVTDSTRLVGVRSQVVTNHLKAASGLGGLLIVAGALVLAWKR